MYLYWDAGTCTLGNKPIPMGNITDNPINMMTALVLFIGFPHRRLLPLYIIAHCSLPLDLPPTL